MAFVTAMLFNLVLLSLQKAHLCLFVQVFANKHLDLLDVRTLAQLMLSIQNSQRVFVLIVIKLLLES